ncbi:MAG: hypothetical protein AAGJ54_03725 [Planctomycetota bacterium]
MPTPLEKQIESDRSRQRENLRAGPIPQANHAILADAAASAGETLASWQGGEVAAQTAGVAERYLRAAANQEEADAGAVYRSAAWAARARGLVERLGPRTVWHACIAAALAGERGAEIVARLGLVMLPAGVKATPAADDASICEIEIDGWPVLAVCRSLGHEESVAHAAGELDQAARARRMPGIAVVGVDELLSRDPAGRFADDELGIRKTNEAIDSILLDHRTAAIEAVDEQFTFALAASAERMHVNAAAKRVGIVAAFRAVNLCPTDDPRAHRLASLLAKLDRAG